MSSPSPTLARSAPAGLHRWHSEPSGSLMNDGACDANADRAVDDPAAGRSAGGAGRALDHPLPIKESLGAARPPGLLLLALSPARGADRAALAGDGPEGGPEQPD